MNTNKENGTLFFELDASFTHKL